MELDEKQELYLELLGKWQEVKRRFDHDSGVSSDEMRKLLELKQKLDSAKRQVFAADPEQGGGAQDASGRARLRDAVRTRIAAVKVRIDALQTDLGAR